MHDGCCKQREGDRMERQLTQWVKRSVICWCLTQRQNEYSCMAAQACTLAVGWMVDSCAVLKRMVDGAAPALNVWAV
jgi:hypothetical protein